MFLMQQGCISRKPSGGCFRIYDMWYGKQYEKSEITNYIQFFIAPVEEKFWKKKKKKKNRV